MRTSRIASIVSVTLVLVLMTGNLLLLGEEVKEANLEILSPKQVAVKQNQIENLGFVGQDFATTLVSISSSGVQGNGASIYSFISADGQYVTFSSKSDNLVSDDSNSERDIFVHDRRTGETTLVSVSNNGMQGNGYSTYPSISSDGRYVVFESWADNLVDSDTNGKPDVFVHDRQTHETTLVSVSSSGIQGNDYSQLYTLPSISADGRCVVFESDSSNLVNDDVNGHRDVFVRDLQTGQTVLASVANNGTQGNFNSSFASISADGRFVAFRSYADNLVDSDNNGSYDVFVHDLQLHKTFLVSVNSNGDQGNDSSGYRDLAISADGRYVAFTSLATNLDLVRDDTNDTRDVFVRDLQLGQTTRVSVSSSGIQANEWSGHVSISGAGRYVAFESLADNLVPDGTEPHQINIFVHDCQTGETALASMANSGMQGNSWSEYPTISADGRYVVFESSSDNLVDNDANGKLQDIFVHINGRGSLLKLSLPFPHNPDENGLNRIYSFFDHEYPLLPPSIGGSEPQSSGIGNTIVLFTGHRRSGTLSQCVAGYNCYSGHNGYDFSYNLPEGTPVLAAAAGELASGTDFCGSHYVKINHGRYQTIYWHLRNDAYWKRSGYINVGERIGSVGNSGAPRCSTGPHLHFGVYYDYDDNGVFENDELVDPYGFDPTKIDPWTLTFTDAKGQQHEGAPSTWLWEFSTPVQTNVIPGTEYTLAIDNFIVNVPDDAVTHTALLALMLATEPDLGAVNVGATSNIRSSSAVDTVTMGHIFQLTGVYPGTAIPMTFAAPISITITYVDANLSYVSEATLGLYYWDETSFTWTQLTTTLNMLTNQAIATTNKLGLFSLRAQSLNPAPALLTVSPSSVLNSTRSEIVVTGTGFLSMSWLNLGMAALDVHYLSSSTITATIPSLLASGVYTLTLRNPDGQLASLTNVLSIRSAVYLPTIVKSDLRID